MAYHDYIVQDILEKIQKNLSGIEQILGKTARDDGGLRPCEVDGVSGYRFHRFVDEDRALIEVKALMRPDEVRRAVEDQQRALFTGPHSTAKILRRTLALVESPNGTLRKVEPDLVRFTDREGAEE